MITKIIKVIVVLIIVIVVIFVIALSIIHNLDDFKKCKNDNKINCPKADFVVVISGGDTSGRTKYGSELVKQGAASMLIVSGASRQEGIPSNAETMKDIAVKEMGLAEEAVIIEPEAKNTRQNAIFVKKIIDNYNQTDKDKKDKSIILVTSGYHQRRANLEFKDILGDNCVIYNAPVGQDKDWSPMWFLSPRGWYLAVREAGGLLISYWRR